MRLGRVKHLPASGGFKPQILLKITSQKHIWSPVKKSKEPNGDLTPSHLMLLLCLFGLNSNGYLDLAVLLY